MAIVKQIWTLMSKNFRSLIFRHLLLCVIMGFILPILLGAFLSFSRNLFVPPANYGIGEPRPIRTLPEAFDHAADSGRNKVVLVNSGYTGGDIDRLLGRLEDQLTAISDVVVARRENEDDIVLECRSSLRGVSTCFNAVVMRSSPNEGNGEIWNYTIRTDGAFASSPFTIDVETNTNPEQVYLLPMQRTVDSLIANIDDPNSNDPLSDNQEYPFTSLTREEREERIREVFSQAIVNFMAVAFIATIIWVTYHLTGFIASERESGMSQLLDAMMPVKHQWMAQAARITAHHLSFSLLYAPGWIIASLIVRQGVFPSTSIGIVLVFHIIAGLALSSMSILFASFFQKAQLSGITAILATLLLGILAQSITAPGTGVVAALSVLFAPCSYVYFATLMARFEKEPMPTSMTEKAPNSPWNVPGIALWIFLIAQIFIYPLIGALIERHFYGTSSSGRRVLVNEEEKRALGDDAVQLQGFTKIYTPSFFSRIFSNWSRQKEPVVAANELSFSVTKGQIVALLGANGSGKSTTLDSIAGLNKLTHGSITINGTGGLGIAPQKNVLWDDLTVTEHLVIFNRLKAPNAPATKAEIDELIRAVDLWPKRKSLAKTLSGGQKRKLQLGMMLTGGSAVCCVDEVSSGIDPLSRRKLWDILLAERGKRTLILTTHFLDEADLLADDIVILSKGSLRAQGSSVELKDNLGGGYRVHVQKNPDMTHTPDIEGVKKENAFDLVTYVAPSSNLAAAVIKELEAAGITDYRFSGPTIEDVFLQLAEEIRDEEAFHSTSKGQELQEKSGSDDYDNVKTSSSQGGLKLMDGQRVGYVKQAWILYRKRFTVLKRNWIPYLIAFILPIAAAGLTSLYVRNAEPTGCSPAAQASRSDTEDAFSQLDDDERIIFLAGPSARFSLDAVGRLLSPIFAGSSSGSGAGLAAVGQLEIVDTFDAFRRFIEENRKNVTTAIWLGDDTQPATIGWVANQFITSSMFAQQFLDVIRTNTSIATTWSPFDVPFSPSTGDALNLVIYMGIALSCYPGFFALYPSNERRRFVRGLQYSNGVRPLPLWLAYLVFDFSIALVAAALVTAIWAGISNVWFHLEYVFVIMFLYGLAATLFAYFVSLFTKSQLSTFAWAAAGQALLFLIYLIAYMCVQTYAEADKIDELLRICHFVISAVAPIGSVLRGLFVTLNLFSTACDGDELSKNPGGILAFGGPILYLIVQSLLLFGLILWFDSGSVGSSLRGLFQSRNTDLQASPSDEEVAHELERITSSGTREDGLKVMHLTKSFGKNTAVDNVSFGVKHGEVFALLGPNGAGKSTTISMIRGDLKPSRNGGDVFVEDVSVTKNLAAARANLGVCPQIDALDQMTVREHLEFYAKVRGIPDVEHNVAQILHAVGLEAFSTRMAHALSGGNKRKLSLGVALMGNPTVVLLDEPSSGLDAASKRIMWKTLAATIPGRSILLTTHSMEEADALAGRAGILARRMLALGTPDDLRHRFGDALHIHLVSSSAPRTSDEEMQRVLDWIRSNFPSADVDKKTYHGQIRFSVRASEVLAASRGESSDVIRQGHNISQSAIGHLVVMLEEQRTRLGVGHYSVSPTGLDQVFLTIVGQHNVREENYEEPKETWWTKLWRFGRS
ncbi:ABC transporter A family member-like protein [Paramyrothecium foliicola]|nr:ABC transporter A family member-like protein [Paramyrothecium foliicola]